MNKETLSAYLPYDVKVKIPSAGVELAELVWVNNFGMAGCHEIGRTIDEEYEYKEIKLILKPLSQLTEEMEHNGERFIPIDYIEENYYTLDWYRHLKKLQHDSRWLNNLDYGLVTHLLEWHFDVFGLIEKEQAITK